MAIKCNLIKSGFALTDAYIRVTSVRMTRGAGRTLVGVEVFSDAGAPEAIESRAFDFPYTPDATVAWAYEQLKTLPEFAGAVDV